MSMLIIVLATLCELGVVTHCAKRYREKTSIAVIMAVYPPDGVSKGTISICRASSGPSAILLVSIIGGVIFCVVILFVCMQCGQLLILLYISCASPG